MKRLVALSICIAACTSTAAVQRLPACPYSPSKDLSDELPIPDYLDTILACNARMTQGQSPPALPPRSAWLESERLLYQNVLAKRPVDILIVPFQVQGYGLDRIERSLMTAELAYAIGSASQYKIADPFLVARALGEGARRVDSVEAERVARKLGATKIITGYVGHDLHHAFTLTLQVQDLPATPSAPVSPVSWHQDWRAVAFTDERMPAVVFNDMLPDVLRALPLKLTAHERSARGASSAASARVTQTPRELVSASGGPGSTSPVAAFDLLGALGTLQSELSRERAFERALLFSMMGQQTGPTDRFLRAYALTQLWRRPAALATLAGETSAESIALVAILNGDLPSAQKAVAQVPQSLQRLLLDAGLHDLESAYGRKTQAKPTASEQTFGLARPQWEPLVQLRVQDTDRWSVVDPLVIKALLDQTFPIPGLDTKSILLGNAVTRSAAPDDVEVDLSNERHVRRAATQIEPVACCKARDLRPTQWDLLWLLEGLGEGRISKSLERQISLQAVPESALQNLNRYEPLLSGQPALELSRSDAAGLMYNKSVDDMSAGWRAQLEQGAAVAARHAPGQNRIAFGALAAKGTEWAAYFVDAYGHDYPRRPFWPMWSVVPEPQEGLIALSLEALAFSTSDVEPLDSLLRYDPGHKDAVIASLGSRFMGNPQRPVANLGSTASGEPQSRIQHLEAAIKSDPETWANYQALGSYIVKSGGAYEAARDAFLRYPGFRERHPDDPVAVAAYAYGAGSLLYWQGLPGLAEPLYKISADLDTGSDASLTSQARLRIMEGDNAGAAEILLERASRYDDPYGYRDYLSFLHAFGKSEEAWQGFSQIKASFVLPQVWVSALVGHQRQGLRTNAVHEWLMKPEIRDAELRRLRFAPYYAILWSSTDHMPAADLGKFVERLGGPPVAKIDANGYTLLAPGPDSNGELQIVKPSPFRSGKYPKLPPDTPVKSDLAYFADAYAAVRLGDYETAVTRFVAMAERYPIEGYPLAYFAYAAAKTGDKQQLEKYLESRVDAYPAFDSWLAKAFFAGSRKDAGAALQALRSAFRSMPYTDYRPVLTEYEYAQACEWLLKDTGDSRFADMLLDWAKKHQQIQPTHAWAYAMEYAYEKPGPERTRALALARYLDPASDRIQKASKEEINAAHAWFREHNPFRIPGPGVDHPAKVAAVLSNR